MKKELQSNVNGMTLGGGSIQHPLSIHSASIGTRWKSGGIQVLMTLVFLFTMGIGQMWGTEYALVSDPTGTPALTTNFHTGNLTLNQNTANTIDGIAFKKAVKFGSALTSISGKSAGDNCITYDVKSTTTEFTVYIANSTGTLYFSEIEEGKTSTTVDNKSVSTNPQKLTFTYNSTKKTTVGFSVSATNMYIYQIVANETGTAYPKAGEAGYQLNLNKGRYGGDKASSNSGKSGKVDDIEFVSYNAASYTNSQAIELGKNTTDTYILFTTGSSAVNLKVTFSAGTLIANTSKSTTGGIALTTDVAAELAANTPYYIINTNASNRASITKIAFEAPSGGGCSATAEAGENKETTVGVGVAMAATAAGDGYTGAWSIKAGSPSEATSQLGTTSSNTMTFTPNTYGTYTLVWTVTDDSDGSCSATDEATVTVPAPTHAIEYTNTKGAVNTNPDTYTEGTGIASFAKLRHVVGYDFTGWSPSSISSSATTNQTIDAQWTANAVAEGTGTLTYALAFGSGTVTTSSITRVNGALYDATDVSLDHTSFNNNSTSKGCSGKLTTTAAKDNNNYVEVTFKVADGYTFTPTEVRVQGIAVSTTKTIEVELKDNAATPHEKSVSGTLTAVSSPTDGGYTVTLDFDETGEVAYEGTVTAKIFAYGAADHWRMGTPFVITGTVASTTPASGYAITKSATNGTIAVTNGTDAITSADENDVVCIAATPNTGYEFTSWSVYKTGDTETTVTLAADDDEDAKTRKFTMPAYPITVGATFTAIDYTVTHNAADNGSYTIKVGTADAVNTNTTANYGQTVTLAATPNSGYVFSAWTVMNGETPVSVTNNTFTMPAGNVTVSATFVEAPTPCYSFTAPTDQAVTFHKDDAITGSTGGSINVYSEAMNGDNSKNGIAFDSNGLKLAGGSDDRIRVTLNNLMQVGSVITVNLTSGTGTSNPRGLYLKNESNSNVKDANNQNVLFGWATTPETSTQATFTYTVRANDGLAGKNVFILQRSNTVWIRSMSVSECGAELHALTSAIDPVHDPAYATVTLSKTLVATGATATATYSAIDAAYDFDEWQISGATIDDAKANPVTITMSSTDATITLKLKAAAVKHKVTYYDNTTKLGEEDINEGSNPTGAGLAPHKLGYTFAGWSTTNGGAATALSGITVSADMPLYAVWNAVNCATKTGTIYTMSIAVAPAENCTIKTASGFESTWDLYQYEGIVGGEAMIGNTGSSNNCILQTNKTVLLKDNTSYMKLDFDCPLKEGDTIKTNVTGSGKAAYISTADTRPEESAALAIISNSTTGKLVVPAALNNATSVYLWKGGGNVTITSIEIVRPVKHTVSFNMNGHGDAIDPEYVVDGAKATEPDPAPTASGYRFVEWQLSGSAYDFDETVTTDITLDAVWQQTWNVTFNADNGSDPVVVAVDNNQPVAQPVDPEKSGYDFVEWQLSGSAYNFATLVTGNITLTATWQVAQDDASLSALSYNGNAIDVSSAVDVSGVQTYTVHLPWGSTIDAALISVTKSAESADISSITYDSENKRASFMVTSGNGSVSINYAIQFVIDAKRGTSIIKATTNNEVTGLIGGTIDQSFSGSAASRKLNKQTYFGMTLAGDATFQEGDVIIINITAPADLGKFMVYADAERTELVADQGIVYTKPEAAVPVLCPTGEMMMTLPAAANGKKSLYLSRENGDTQWNVTFSSLDVVREMSPAIKSFKFGDEAATINEAAKTITIEVPFSTDVTALTPTVEAYGNNGATYTPSGATDFTSPVDYVVTDAYSELSTTYAVTVTKAAASENANLASLAVAGYSLDFDPATTSYNVVLDYGTTVLPAITYEVAEVGLATAEKVEGSVNSATTITVTPEAGTGYEKVYTINFSVSTNPKYVIYDGSTMTNIASATGSDVTTGFSYSLASSITLTGDAISGSWGGKDYTHVIKNFKPTDNVNNIVSFVIPEGYVAKVRLVGTTNSTGTERKLFIAMSASKDAADAIDNYIITSSTYDAQGFVTDYLLPNTYYLGSTDSYRLFEFSIQLYPIDEERDMTQGRFGTICYPNGGYLVGAMLLEIAYFDPDQKKIFFDEVISGQMVAGAPYLFLPDEGVDKFAIVYTDAANAPAGHHNGLYGSYTQEELPTDGNHYIMLNNQYCKVVAANTCVGANRAYIKLDKIGNDYVAPAYGRRRVSLNVQQSEVVTGIDGLNVGDQPIKIMIDGTMYIIRGEKMYDATGRLVK